MASYPNVEFALVIAGADLKSVVGTRVDTGCLNLEDVGGHRAIRRDAHVTMDDGGRLISTQRVGGWAEAAAMGRGGDGMGRDGRNGCQRLF